MTDDTHETQVQYCVNTTECSGCQACIEMCPELFGWDDVSERVVLKKECAIAEDIDQAIAYCPNDCIERLD